MTISAPPRYAVVQCPPDLIPRDNPTKQQVLWIGCSDSGFEETTILDLSPDETIVLRNMGNMLVEDDMSCASMVEYAMSILQVRLHSGGGDITKLLIRPFPRSNTL